MAKNLTAYNETLKVGDIVQMENRAFHGDTKGKVIEINDSKAKIIWGDYQYKNGWHQTTNTDIHQIIIYKEDTSSNW
jgi:hypothetical protein